MLTARSSKEAKCIRQPPWEFQPTRKDAAQLRSIKRGRARAQARARTRIGREQRTSYIQASLRFFYLFHTSKCRVTEDSFISNLGVYLQPGSFCHFFLSENGGSSSEDSFISNLGVYLQPGSFCHFFLSENGGSSSKDSFISNLGVYLKPGSFCHFFLSENGGSSSEDSFISNLGVYLKPGRFCLSFSPSLSCWITCHLEVPKTSFRIWREAVQSQFQFEGNNELSHQTCIF